VAQITALELKDYFAYPVTGAAPATALSYDDPAQYTGTIAWTVTGGETPLTGSFAPSTAYTAVVSLTAAAGWTFDGVTENSFTYSEDHASSASNEAGGDMTLTVTVSFAATDAITGEAGITVNVASEEMVVTGYNPPVSIAQNGIAVTWSVTGYTDVSWTPDEGSVVSGDAFTVTPSAYSVKKHTVVVVGTKGGIPYSAALEFTITAGVGAGGGDDFVPEVVVATFIQNTNNAITTDTVTSALEAKAENTPETPYKLQLTEDSVIKDWRSLGTALINGGNKYVFLDMNLTSRLNMPKESIIGTNQDFSAVADVSGYFHYILIEMNVNIVGFHPTYGLLKIAKYAFINTSTTPLKELVIPATVNQWANYDSESPFTNSGFTKVTVLGTTLPPQWANGMPGGTGDGTLAAVYGAAVTKPGVYTFDGTAWSRADLPVE
jgi:hypothetical protein